MELDEVNRLAKELYAQGQDKILLDALAKITPYQYALYSEIVLQCAKIYLVKGEHTTVQRLLGQFIDIQKSDLEGEARAFWMLAQLAFNENDLSGALVYISRVQDRTENPSLLAECEMLMGEAIKHSKPKDALKHFAE